MSDSPALTGVDRTLASVSGGAPVGRDRALKIVKLLARDQTDILERREMFLGFAWLAKRQIEFTEVLMRGAMPTIECLSLIHI